MLSTKLYEDRIVMVESEKIDYLKTKYLHEILKPYKSDKLLFLTPFDPNFNFMKACQNLQNIQAKNP